VAQVLQAGCPSCHRTNTVKALTEIQRTGPASGLASSFLQPLSVSRRKGRCSLTLAIQH